MKNISDYGLRPKTTLSRSMSTIRTESLAEHPLETPSPPTAESRIESGPQNLHRENKSAEERAQSSASSFFPRIRHQRPDY